MVLGRKHLDFGDNVRARVLMADVLERRGRDGGVPGSDFFEFVVG